MATRKSPAKPKAPKSKAPPKTQAKPKPRAKAGTKAAVSAQALVQAQRGDLSIGPKSHPREVATELKRQGYTVRETAGLIGCTPGEVVEWLRYELDSDAWRLDEPERLVRLEAARLDEMGRLAMAAARDGELSAIDRALKVFDRRAKMLGIDAPTKTETTVTVQDPAVARAKLESMLGRIEDANADDQDPSE